MSKALKYDGCWLCCLLADNFNPKCISFKQTKMHRKKGKKYNTRNSA